MVPFRFSTDEATVTRVQSNLIIVSYHRLADISVACIKWLVIFDRFRGIICHNLTIVWCPQLTVYFRQFYAMFLV